MFPFNTGSCPPIHVSLPTIKVEFSMDSLPYRLEVILLPTTLTPNLLTETGRRFDRTHSTCRGRMIRRSHGGGWGTYRLPRVGEEE